MCWPLGHDLPSFKNAVLKQDKQLYLQSFAAQNQTPLLFGEK
jgi:hypothetical protein